MADRFSFSAVAEAGHWESSSSGPWNLNSVWVSSVADGLQEMMRKDEAVGRGVVGKWVNFTLVDLDAHGLADCVATFKLGHDNKRTTQDPVRQRKKGREKRKRKKNKSMKCTSKGKENTDTEAHMKET